MCALNKDANSLVANHIVLQLKEDHIIGSLICEEGFDSIADITLLIAQIKN